MSGYRSDHATSGCIDPQLLLRRHQIYRRYVADDNSFQVFVDGRSDQQRLICTSQCLFPADPDCDGTMCLLKVVCGKFVSDTGTRIPEAAPSLYRCFCVVDNCSYESWSRSPSISSKDICHAAFHLLKDTIISQGRESYLRQQESGTGGADPFKLFTGTNQPESSQNNPDPLPLVVRNAQALDQPAVQQQRTQLQLVPHPEQSHPLQTPSEGSGNQHAYEPSIDDTASNPPVHSPRAGDGLFYCPYSRSKCPRRANGEKGFKQHYNLLAHRRLVHKEAIPPQRSGRTRSRSAV
ncbi:hypothetical protein BJ508DRAFT_301513 [Ascobolus immersus RN42]|uniref:Uncharacterized protein n=1 Tax=Ascobolus immersus RN42 TaxID=1160509 RepID=A0A3N4IKM4_ASCIM|nr:hypothetical protein BJ508DRAFT_301513 [Ascobolus immersus RN42]